MPKEGVPLLKHEDILSYEEIAKIVRYAVDQGVKKVRLTGGEPLIRRNITTLIKMISEIKGVQDFSMTTNGVLLENYATELAESGLHRVNVSLDTLNSEKFQKITRFGDVNTVIRGIFKADEAGLSPIKINMVVSQWTAQRDKDELSEFCEKHNYELRFIHQMNLEEGEFSIVEGGHGGDCKSCNRLRLTADGNLKPCLFSNQSYDVREMGIEQALKKALNNKPLNGTKNDSCSFHRIGG
jgi:cyclic pyranopterin phosphate synthase